MGYFIPCVFALGLLSAPASAAVFERDWKTPGDGLLTFDTVNKREWLDVPQSLLFHYGSFELVVAETVPGGDFEGFTPAKMADVLGLAESAGIDIGTLDYATNQIASTALVELLGATISSSSGVSTLGLTDGFLDNSTSPLDRILAAVGVQPPYQIAGLSFLAQGEISSDRPFLIIGVMMYRVVPEPSVCLLILSTLFTCTFCRPTKLKRLSA